MKRRNELLVGSVILLGIVAGVGGTLWLQGSNWGRETTRVELLVRDVGQLTEGNAVKFRGVQIGRVMSIDVEPNGNAVRVGLQLEGQVELPEDAQAIIAPESMFGDWQCEIVTRDRFPRFDYYPVPTQPLPGGVRVLGGYAIPDISRLTAAADEISENLAVLTDRFDRAFNEETADALAQTIRNIEQVTNDVMALVEEQASTLSEVSEQFQETSGEITAASVAARSTLERIDEVFNREEVDSILVNLETATRSIGEMSETVGSSAEDLRSTLAQADSAFTRINAITGRLEAGEGTLGRLLTDTTLAVNAEALMAELRLFLEDVRENPGRYVRLSIF